MFRNAGVVGLAALALTCCVVDPVGLEGKQCPCGSGYTCLDGRCVREASGAPASSCGAPPPVRAVHLACGQDGTCAIRDGALYCWGRNHTGQLGLGHDDWAEFPERVGQRSEWTYVACGEDHTCGILSEDGFGLVHCWGDNHQRQVADSENLVEPTPVRVGTGSSWVEVCAGHAHTCAIDRAGDVYCRGGNAYGQQGTGTDNGELTLVEL